MSGVDWIVMCVTMVGIIGYGIWRTKGSENIEEFLLGGNEAKWWTIGLSVMATQASAITFLSTPGLAYQTGLDFLQFYLMLPIALIIICITFIPLYYRLKVYTAYEFLENRFDLKTRTLTSGLFLIQRGLAAGITIYAPAIIISSVMGWNLNITTIFIGIIAVAYTVSGGTKAVHVTHKLQMVTIFLGLIIIFILLLNYLPDEYSFTEMMHIASANDKLQVIDWNFDIKDRYNIYSTFAALFLFLSYFGTDQSQVQRYISGQSVHHSRLGLIFNALFKVPLQLFILMLGLLVFIFYQFNQAPIHFNETLVDKVENSEYSQELQPLINEYDTNFNQRKTTSQLLITQIRDNNPAKTATSVALNEIIEEEKDIRARAKKIIAKVDIKAEVNDKDYVFINFILNYLPKGLVGLLLAAIFFAAMSSTASELNALASTSTVDIHRRLFKQDASDQHYLNASKGWTLFWGLFAIFFASVGTLFESLIEFVNIIGSLFYGTILGIFLVAFYIKHVRGNAVFIAAVITELLVVIIFWLDVVGYLWLNLIGAAGVILLALILDLFFEKKDLQIS